MKNLIRSIYKTFAAFIAISLLQTHLWAQDSASSTTTTTTTTHSWYTQPWVWVVGGAVLLLLLIALMRGNSGTTEKVTVTKTRETDI